MKHIVIFCLAGLLSCCSNLDTSALDGGVHVDGFGDAESDGHPHDADFDMHSDGSDETTCHNLEYRSFGDSRYYPAIMDGCPIDPSQPACMSDDVGALVARSNECLIQSVDANGCEYWSHPFTSELVILLDPFDGCEWPVVVDSVLDCGDHVKIGFSVIKPCQTCDELRPMLQVLHLPNDPKPVHATGTLVHEAPCP